MDASTATTLFSLGLRKVKGMQSDTEKIKQWKHLGSMGWWDRAKEGVKVGVLGAIDPSLSSDYLDTKLGRQEEWEAREAQRQLEKKLSDTANLQTEAQRQILNRQLQENISTLNINKAGMGAYRTGGRIKDIEKMQTTMNEDVARVTQANSLNAMLAGMGLKQSQQQLDIQMAQLELAKQTGDTDMMAGIAEQIGGSDFFSKLFQKNKPANTASTLTGSPAPSDQNEYGATYGYSSPLDSLLLSKPYTPSQIGIPNIEDNYNQYGGQGTGFNAPSTPVDYGIQSSGLSSEEAIGFTDTEWDEYWGGGY